MRGYEKHFWKLNNSKNILKPSKKLAEKPSESFNAVCAGSIMLLHSMVLGQVTQGGCVQTHRVFGSEELKALSWAHSDWREIFSLHWGQAKLVGNWFLMQNKAACA